MAGKWFLYDNDARTLISRQFNVFDGKPVVLKGGDLVDPVQIYIAVGQCIGCDNDFVWEPFTICGNPVSLSSEQSAIAISTPGLYNLGDPMVEPLVLGPNTNVLAETVLSVPVELSNPCPSGSSGGGSCDDPLHVKICDMTEIEISDVVLGCAYDAAGDAIGSVLYSRDVDEETGFTLRIISAVLYDGTVVSPYSGPWGPCPVLDTCESEAFMGVLTDLSLLNQG